MCYTCITLLLSLQLRKVPYIPPGCAPLDTMEICDAVLKDAQQDSDDACSVGGLSQEMWSPGEQVVVATATAMTPKYDKKSHQQLINKKKKEKKDEKQSCKDGAKKAKKKDEKKVKKVQTKDADKKGKPAKKKQVLTEAEKARKRFASKAYHKVRLLVFKKCGCKLIAKQQARIAHQEANSMWDACNGNFKK